MQIPPSAHFTPLSLARVFNADRQHLDSGLRPRAGEGGAEDWSANEAFGARSYRGVPFALGEGNRPNVILLPGDPDHPAGEVRDVRIDLDGVRATYLVFLHAV